MPDKIVNHFVLADGSTAKYSAEHLAGDVPEVVDIRTGYDGTVYESAGDAVRGQASYLSDLLDELKDVTTEEVETTTNTTTTWDYNLIGVAGDVLVSNSYIHSGKFQVKAGDIIELWFGDLSNYIAKALRITVYNGETAIRDKGLVNGALPFTVPDGVDGVIFSISSAYLPKNVLAKITTTRLEPTHTETHTTRIEEKLVTQIEQVTTVQKQVVESQIDVVDSARNASNHGVLPSNDGTTNFTNLQALIDDGGTIIVDVQGIYEINGMLTIGSDTELLFGKGVFMKQMNNTGGFIVNKGASSNTINQNIRISGLNLMCNGKTGDSSSYRVGLRGKIAFCFVKGLILDNIYVDDIPSGTYFIHIAAYDNVLIQNSHFEGQKDGVHSSCGEHLTIRNCYFNTADDPIALNCQDYPSSIPYYGWIKNVLIENCIDNSPPGTNNAPRGRSILIYGGAWKDWASGNTYRNGDTIVTSDDNVYRFISSTAVSDETAIPSTIEPTHTAGIVEETDGCKWQFVQDTPVYNVACENVTIRNFVVKCPRVDVVRVTDDNSTFVRSIYPNAIMPPHKNITIDNTEVVTPCTYFVSLREPVDLIRITNSKVKTTYCVWLVNDGYLITNDNSILNLSVIGNEFYKESGGIVFILSQKAGRTTNAKTYGNFSNTTMENTVSRGTVNMIANDLF